MTPVHPPPRSGDALRLAFVGQQTFFEACALAERSRRAVTTFVEFRQGADDEAIRAALDAFAPHAVVVFRPEIVPAGAFDGLRAATIGFLTEPIPRTTGRRAHPDLCRRVTFWVAVVILAFMGLLAAFPSLFTGVGANGGCDVRQAKLRPASWNPFAGGHHPFGTDTHGCDYWAQIVHGTRAPIVVGFLVTGIALVLAITLGSLSGY